MTSHNEFAKLSADCAAPLARLPVPEPAAGEVLVEIPAAGINPGEANIRSGLLKDLFPAIFPSGQGSALAGVAAQIGPGVADFAIGEEVLGFSWTRSSHGRLRARAHRSRIDQLVKLFRGRG